MMPYQISNKLCTTCKQPGEFRVRTTTWNKNPKLILISKCKQCERIATKKHQQNNPEYWRKINKKSYLNWTPEQKATRLLESHKRHKRLKMVLWDQELTNLVFEEAHDKRLRLNTITNFEWHVDHIVPLNGKYVSGLHVWNNLQVIPKVINLSKSNKEMTKSLT